MATVRLCGLKPLLYRRKSYACEGMKNSSNVPKKPSKGNYEGKGESMEWSFVSADQLILMMEVHKKILVLRDIIDLPPLNTSPSLREIVIKTLEDLQRLYPGIILRNKVSKIKDKPTDQVLAYFCKALRSIGESWIMNNDCSYVFPSCKDNSNMRQLGETMLATLDCLIKISNEKFDIMEEDDHHQKNQFSPQPNTFGKVTSGSPSYYGSNFFCSSTPATPKSVLPEPIKYMARTAESPRTSPCSSPLWSLRIQAVGKLNPIDLKRLSFHMSPPHKTEKAPNRDMEMDHKDRKPEEKETSEELVFDLDKSEKSDTKTSDHIETNEPEAMEEEEKEEKLLRPNLSSVPSPPLSLTPPPPVPATNVLQPNMKMPPLSLPPPPPLSPKLQQSSAEITMPPPPPLPLPLASSSAAAAPQPPLAPLSLKGGSAPLPLPPMPRGSGGAAPPPPPPGVGRSLRPKATTKLKRSTQLGNLYRSLKGKVEGSSLKGKSIGGRSGAIGTASAAGGKQGMADALAEMTKRSSYFQQIEEDVQKYTKQIIELRPAITNFMTNDMKELVKFRKDVESVLEKLTDESQVLSRFEGFPSKKLEAIRMASALYNKLNSILTELQNWNTLAPVGQLLDKAERYFNKIKTELDALERTKDEESKKLKGHNIGFDFNILVKIKEAMVDVSSSCMEVALKERRNDGGKNSGKLLWRAFQFAFRIYTFAGGIDDRADKLTKQLAMEIESDPPNHHP